MWGNVVTLLWLITAPNSSQKIRVPKFGFKINVSETMSVSIIRIDVEDDHKALIYSYICMYVCIYIYICVCVCVYRLQTNVGPRILYIYIYIYTHTHTHTQMKEKTIPLLN